MTIDYQALFAWAHRNSLALFPIQPGFKKPFGLVDSHAEDWSKDPNQWAQWAQTWPGCNFGVECGPSGLIVLDPDQPIDQSWPEMQTWLIEKGANPDPEFIVQSPTGGYHCYFRVPEAVADELKGQPNISKLVNVRAGNGYVVAPWSYTVAGGGDNDVKATGHYQIIRGENIPFATQGMIDHCKKATGTGIKRGTNADLGADGYPTSPAERIRVQHAVNLSLAAIRNAEEGTRNDTLNRSAFDLMKLVEAGALDEAVAHDLLTVAAMEIGLEADETRRTLESSGHAARTTAMENRGAVGFRKPEAIFGTPTGAPTQEVPEVMKVWPKWTQGDTPPPPPTWLIKGVLPDNDLSMIVSPKSGGKSTVAMALALSVMTGHRFVGNRIAKSGGVLYLAAEAFEMVHASFQTHVDHKYKKLLQGVDDFNTQSAMVVWDTPNQPAPDNMPWILRKPKGTMMIGRQVNSDFMAQFRAVVQDAATEMQNRFGQPLRLIVIDTLARFAGWEDENDTGTVVRAMAAFESIRDEFGVAILLVDHAGRSGTHARGASAKEDSVNGVLRITDTRDANDIITDRRVHVGKVKAGEMGKGANFDIDVRTLTVDEDGDPINLPIVKWKSHWELPRAKPKAEKVETPANTKTQSAAVFIAPPTQQVN